MQASEPRFGANRPGVSPVSSSYSMCHSVLDGNLFCVVTTDSTTGDVTVEPSPSPVGGREQVGSPLFNSFSPPSMQWL